MCVSNVQHMTGRKTGCNRSRPVFFGFSIFRQTSQLATEKIQNLCNRNRWSGLLRLGSVRFRSFFQSSELDLRTLFPPPPPSTTQPIHHHHRAPATTQRRHDSGQVVPSPGKQHNPPPCLLIDTNQRCHVAAGDMATRRRCDNRDTHHHLAPRHDHNGHATTRLRQPQGLTTTNQQLPTTTPCRCPQMKTDRPRTKMDAPEQRRPPMNEGYHPCPRTKTTAHEREQMQGTMCGPQATRADTGNDVRTREMTRGHGQQCADTGHNAWTQATMRGHRK